MSIPTRFLCAGLSFLCGAGWAPAVSRPNILVVIADDMGVMDTSVSFAGDGVVHPLNRRYRTPHMEKLAARGMKFLNTYACSVCTPSRTSLMTGQNATRHHVTTWTAVGKPLDTGDAPGSHRLLAPANWKMAGMEPDGATLPRLLRDAGYRTIAVGKGHFGPDSERVGDPRSIGFDISIAGSGLGGPGSYLATERFMKSNPAHQVPGLQAYFGRNIFLTEALTLEMVKQLNDAAKSSQPFFAYMSHYAVHSPFENADPRFTADYALLSGDERNYATLVEGVDQSLGDLLAKLEALDVAENTLVVFLSDNGSDGPIPFGGGQIGPAAPLRGKKGHPYEGGVRVPLIISWAKFNPENPFQRLLPIAAGSETRDLVAIWDLFPTLLAAAGVRLDARTDGFDLRPYLSGRPGRHRPQEFVLNFPHSHEYEDFYALMRKDDWKVIYRYLSKSYELYNLAKDPGEQQNLAGDATGAVRLMQLSRHMARRLRALNAQAPRDRHAPANPATPLVTPDLTKVDTDGDGMPDVVEDPNRNGLVDPGETDPDHADN